MTGELGNKIDSLWEIFWNGGITNPLDVVEQMTYLMFIKDLSEPRGQGRWLKMCHYWLDMCPL